MKRIKKKKLLWMKTIHSPNKIRSHLVTIVAMAHLLQNQLQSCDLLRTLDMQ